MKHFLTSLFLLSWCLHPMAHASPLPRLEATFEAAAVRTTGDRLTVTTGKVERTWQWTGKGLATVSLKDLRTGKEWANASPAGSDWLATGIAGDAPGELLSLTAGPSDDSGFTTKHLKVRAEIAYPADHVVVAWEIWAYPGSDGFRTQLWLKKTGQEAVKQSEAPPVFTILTGKPVPMQDVAKTGPAWQATALQDGKCATVKLEGLRRETSYHMGLSWWDPAGEGRTQQVTVTSIDGEARRLLVKPTVLPDWKLHQQPAATVTADLPPEMNADGTVKLLIEKVKGPASGVCEIWLYGPGPAPELEIDPARRAELEKLAPQGSALIAYFHAGANGTQTVAPRQEARAEFLPVTTPRHQAAGYFNDTQNRHRAATHLLREEAVPSGRVDWANLVCLESDDGGVAVVKESHKCVNQPGVDTGAFEVEANGLSVTGWGLPTDALSPGFQWCWGTWTLLYTQPTRDAREMAIKRFDRTRYPVTRALDLYLKANTWGSGTTQASSFERAKEDEVLAEIDSVADLGLDALQIDDGWQVGRMRAKPPGAREWRPRPDWYPDGWSKVVARAKERNVDLGVWFAAYAPIEDLKWSFDQAAFKTYKLDFANIRDYGDVAGYLAKGRDLIEHSGHRAKVNWDVTENAPRFGYFWARECGSVWLANRKPLQPDSVVARPWLMLRESWELARYLNSNKFELPIQNFRTVAPASSDARLHSDTYSVALGLSGIPVFFQTTRLLEADQRTEIKALLKPYKEIRDQLFERFVFPIGAEPSNKSWSGFQWVDPDTTRGYLLVFRERLNEEKNKRLPLRFLKAGSRLRIDDLRSGQSRDITLDQDAAGAFPLDQPGDVLLLRYQVE